MRNKLRLRSLHTMVKLSRVNRRNNSTIVCKERNRNLLRIKESLIMFFETSLVTLDNDEQVIEYMKKKIWWNKHAVVSTY